MGKEYKIGFWNYTKTNILDPKECVNDWKTLGMNIAMSSECSSDEDKDYILKNMDECYKQGIKVIVCDRRARFGTLKQVGKEKFIEGVKAAAKCYANHPAFYAFHIGDEPDESYFPYAVDAINIVKEYGKTFINFFPFFEEDFEKSFSKGHDGYEELIIDLIKKTGIDTISYDCYYQMFVHEQEEGINRYFYNLNRFRKIADKTGVTLWTTLLSVGHWCYRVPSEDDIRWQMSTAIAHGVDGVMWFYIYGRFLESSYRLSPFDQFYKKTQTFDALERQMKLFETYFKERLERSKLINVKHVGRQYGGTELYTASSIETLVFTRRFNCPLIVSTFEEENGKRFLLFVNNAQNDVEQIIGKYKGEDFVLWLAPGQMTILE